MSRDERMVGEPIPQGSSPSAIGTQRASFGNEPVRLPVLPRPKWLRENQWPFETVGVTVDGSTIAVTQVGSGPVLLFVHVGMWSFVWRDLLLRLADSFRCICFDAPGTGLSLPLPKKAMTLENCAGVVAAVIKHLHLENVTLVLHDLGGPAGLAGVSAVAERIRGIVAMNAFGWKPTGALFRGMLAVMGSNFMAGLDEMTGLLPRITASSFGVGRRLDSVGRKVFFAGLRHRGFANFHHYMQDARRCDALYDRVEEALAGPLRVRPLLTIFGERNDPLGFQRRWKELYPSARQVVVRKGNHFPMCDDPDFVASAIRSWHRERVAPSIARDKHA